MSISASPFVWSYFWTAWSWSSKTCTPSIAHGNDSLFYTAVEPNSLIAVLWHYVLFSSFDCL